MNKLKNGTGSPIFRLYWSDVKKVLTGGAVAVSGALIAYLTAQITELSDDGTTSAIVLTTVLSIIVNALRKFITDTQNKP